MSINRSIAIVLVFSMLLELCIPLHPLFANEESSQIESSKDYQFFGQLDERLFRNFRPRKDENLDPEAIQKIIDSSTTETFVGNPTLREEKSSVLRPLKQIGLRVLDGEIGIIQTFLSYEAVEFIEKHFTTRRSNQAIGTARKVIEAMSPEQLKGVNGALKKYSITDQISKALRNSPVGVQKFMRSEANFALMALIGTLISMGIYDGLDVSTVKDKILALDPLQFNYSASQGVLPNYLGGVASRRFYSLFNGKFDQIYDRLLNSKSFGGYLLKQIDTRADVIGQKIFKATRQGRKKRSGVGLAKRLGLVGVGEGTQFTLKGFLRSLTTGLAYGLGAQVVIDSVVIGARGNIDAAVVGGNRNKMTLRPEYNAFIFQRSNSEIQNWLKERKFALMDLYDGYRKTPLTKLVGATSGMVGGYFGSVVAGALLVGGGLPAIVGGVMIASLFAGIGSFLGKWATLKFERGKYMKNIRRELVERRLYRAILKMDVHLSGRLDKQGVRDLARNRSEDMSKRESFGQNYNRMYLVESFEKILLSKKQEITWINIAEKYGEACEIEAHIRYDFIDIHGDRGIWDFVTDKIFNVGNVQQNNAFSIIFVTDSEKIIVEGDELKSQKGSEFRVLSNGLIMTMSDLDSTKWVIRGQNANTDVFLRNSKKRFKWDYDRQVFVQVNTLQIASTGSLDQFKQFFENMNDEDAVKSNLIAFLNSKFVKAKQDSQKLVESVTSENELKFFLRLEKMGVQKDRTEQFAGMRSSGWKTFLMGRLQRNASREFTRLLDQIGSMQAVQLRESLYSEIKDTSAVTIWDQILACINVDALMVSASR